MNFPPLPYAINIYATGFKINIINIFLYIKPSEDTWGFGTFAVGGVLYRDEHCVLFREVGLMNWLSILQLE